MGVEISDRVSSVIIDAHEVDFARDDAGSASGPAVGSSSQDAEDEGTRKEPAESVAAPVHSGPRGIDRRAALAALPDMAKDIVARLEANDAMSVDQLAESLQVHANTVRSHLETLLSSGLVRRRPRRSGGRGRPQWLYSAVRASKDGQLLVKLLADYITQNHDDAFAKGREIARDRSLVGEAVVPVGDEAPEVALVEGMSELGFSPEIVSTTAEQTEVHLRTCPVLDLVQSNRDVICGLHAGLVDRAWEDLGGDGAAEVEPFAGPGFCRVALRIDRSAGQTPDSPAIG